MTLRGICRRLGRFVLAPMVVVGGAVFWMVLLGAHDAVLAVTGWTYQAELEKLLMAIVVVVALLPWGAIAGGLAIYFIYTAVMDDVEARVVEARVRRATRRN